MAANTTAVSDTRRPDAVGTAPVMRPRRAVRGYAHLVCTGLPMAVFVCACLAIQSGNRVQAAAGTLGTGAQTKPVQRVAETLLPLTVDHTAYRLPVYVNRPLAHRQPDITRAIIVVHGALRNAEAYFTAVRRAAVLAGDAGRQALIIAPQFLSEVDEARYEIPLDVPVWSVDGWKGGSLSEIRRDDSTDRRISSFAMLDALLLMLLDRERWPSLAMVVLAGHSAGGQFVQRYAAAGQAPKLLHQRGIQTRFIVANPSSYLYFDDRRPQGLGFAAFPRARCPTFNDYKYGLERPSPYVADQTTHVLRQHYARRQVVYLLGTVDADATHPFLDHSCAAEAQGPTRLARGEAYYRYLQQLLGHNLVRQQHLVLVTGVGHDHQGMFQSPCGVAWLFADGQC